MTDTQTYLQKSSAFFHLNYYTHHRKEKLGNLSRISVKWISIRLQTLMRGRYVQLFLCILSAFVHGSESNWQLIDSELGKAFSGIQGLGILYLLECAQVNNTHSLRTSFVSYACTQGFLCSPCPRRTCMHLLSFICPICGRLSCTFHSSKD